MFVETRQLRGGASLAIAERRGSSRHSIVGVANVSAVGFPPVVGTIENIGVGGCFIAFPHPLPIKCKVTAHIDLGVTTFVMEGVVCRQVPGRGFAIQFCA